MVLKGTSKNAQMSPNRGSGRQPRHRRRGHVPRRGRALATPAPAGPDDGVLVGLDIDLEESGAPLAVGGIGLAAARTDARILRRIARFLLLSEPGALGAPVSGGAALLAATAPGARLLLPLAPAAVERLRQDAAGRAQLVEVDFQLLDPRGQRRVLALQLPHLGAQPGILLPQRRDQLRCPHDCRPHPAVAFAQPRDRALPGLHQPPGRRELPVELLAQRLGDALALAVHLHNLRAPSVDVLLQPVDLVPVALFDLLPVLVRPAQRQAKIGDLAVLGLDPALQRLCDPRRGLRHGRLELEPAGVEPPRQRVRKRSGLTFRPAQFLAAQLRHIRAAPFLLDARLRLFEQRRPVERLAHRCHDGKRPQGVAALGRRQVGAEILVKNRHARDGSACAE